jgi:hypothetical protein
VKESANASQKINGGAHNRAINDAYLYMLVTS